jgi:GNAT superfamily N-acetyltransferase
MSEADIDFVLKKTTEEHWEYSRIEIERMLDIDRSGSFVWDDGELKGFVTTVHCGRTGVIGHLLVTAPVRGKGIGRRLLEEAVAYLEGRGMNSIVVYATSAGRRVYEASGFRVDHTVLSGGYEFSSEQQGAVMQTCPLVTPDDLDAIISLDEIYFGDDRSQVIRRLYSEFPQDCYKLERDGAIRGFIFGRRTPLMSDIGPWLSTSRRKADAKLLFDTLISSIPVKRVDFALFADNKHVFELVSPFKTVKDYTSKLMVRGERRYTGALEDVYSNIAFELG